MPIPASPTPSSVVIARVIAPRWGGRGMDPAAMAPTTAPAPKAREEEAERGRAAVEARVGEDREADAHRSDDARSSGSW